MAALSRFCYTKFLFRPLQLTCLYFASGHNCGQIIIVKYSFCGVILIILNIINDFIINGVNFINNEYENF